MTRRATFAAPLPLFAGETTAARLMDMKAAAFSALVDPPALGWRQSSRRL